MSTMSKTMVLSLTSYDNCLISLTPDATALSVDKVHQGLVYSCRMLKERMHLEDGTHMQIMGPLGCKYPDNRNFVKEVVTCKAAASFVSQKSFATRLLATGLPANVRETSGSNEDPVLRIPENSLETCSLTECRNLLRRHALNLLETSGWLIRKHKRPSRQSEEYKYTSPGGRPVRELCRAWRICGEMLIAGGSTMALEDDVKEWDSFSVFFSDVKGTLARVETELTASVSSNALTHRWILLDPFISVFFIDKKIRALRKGEVVKVRRSCAPGSKENATLDWKDKFHNRDPFRGRNISVSICNSSKNQKNESRVVTLRAERSNHGSGRQPLCEGDARGVEEDTSIVTWETGDGLMEDKDAEKIGKLPIAINQCSKFCYSLFQSDHSSCKLLCERFKSVNSDSKSGSHVVSCSVNFKGPDISLFGTSRVFEQCDHDKMECVQCTAEYVMSRKKMKKKSKRISEIESTTLSDDGLFRQTYLPSAMAGVSGFLDHSDEDKDIEGTGTRSNDGNSKKKREHEKGSGDAVSFKVRTKRSRKCDIGDNDLLASVLVQNDKVGPFASQSIPKRKAHKLKARKMLKARSDGWRLLPRHWGKAGKLLMEKKWSLLGARTVLSWIINAGVISPNDVIQYRDLEDNTIIKDGLITWDGIICKCCGQVLSVSQFKIHSGFKSNHICLNLFMKESGPFSLCALEAWSSEYKTRKNARVAVQVDEIDHNDDLCAVCGDAGELICCDNCPATYHQSCLLTKDEDLPEGDWYCPSCRCRICQELVDDQNSTVSSDAMKCLQCEHKYHESCLKRRNGNRAAVDGCFCGESCQQVYSVLRSRIGIMNQIADGYSWILLRCFHDDLKFPSAAKFAFKAECNSKLAVALSLMEECFLSMVDPRTGIDMIPHVLYNWGSDLARLNFDNFYTVVLENDDVLIAAASIRVHGVAVAEMPLIATCSKYRRQGMCRRLVTAVEELLLAMRVEKLVIAALPQLVETWTKGFGFQILEDDERHALSNINLMVFPGTVLLKKTLYTNLVVPSAVICCGLEAGGSEAGEATEICCALEAEPASAMSAGMMEETTPVAAEDVLAELDGTAGKGTDPTSGDGNCHASVAVGESGEAPLLEKDSQVGVGEESGSKDQFSRADVVVVQEGS